jgi:hypothetical protein
MPFGDFPFRETRDSGWDSVSNETGSRSTELSAKQAVLGNSTLGEQRLAACEQSTLLTAEDGWLSGTSDRSYPSLAGVGCLFFLVIISEVVDLFRFRFPLVSRATGWGLDTPSAPVKEEMGFALALCEVVVSSGFLGLSTTTIQSSTPNSSGFLSGDSVGRL